VTYTYTQSAAFAQGNIDKWFLRLIQSDGVESGGAADDIALLAIGDAFGFIDD